MSYIERFIISFLTIALVVLISWGLCSLPESWAKVVALFITLHPGPSLLVGVILLALALASTPH